MCTNHIHHHIKLKLVIYKHFRVLNTSHSLIFLVFPVCFDDLFLTLFLVIYYYNTFVLRVRFYYIYF